MDRFDRAFPLEGIEILSRAKGGDGRTVEAYAAVYETPTEIRDQHGHYNEVIDPTAFKRTLANGNAMRALVLYNHGRSVVDGKVDSLAQVTLGSPVEITTDLRGLRTVTRYNKSALADSVLEAVKAGDIRAQSFRGGIYRSDPNGKVPRSRNGELPTVRRLELGLSDYGPTPSPYYEGAAIVAVRSIAEVASLLADLSDDDRRELIRALETTRHIGDPEPASGTPDLGLATADSPAVGHSGRLALLRLRAQAEFAGVTSGKEAIRDHL